MSGSPQPSTARILISNDDGMHAPGLKALERIARALSRDVWVVAPETEQSGASHSLTLTRPLRIRRISRRRFAVDGTPTDCVVLAINKIVTGRRPTLLLAGVNRGGNLGEDATYSGTVAAAMEGAYLGLPSIALSQVYVDRQAVRWATAERWGPEVIRRLIAAPWPKGVLINVNFPDVPAATVTGVAVCRLGRRRFSGVLSERIDPRGRAYFWIGGDRVDDLETKGTDVVAVDGGAVAITPLGLDLTHRPTARKLARSFAEVDEKAWTRVRSA